MKMTTKAIDSKIKDLRELIASWRDRLSELRTTEAELAKQQAALRSRSIRQHDAEAQQQLESLRLMVEFSSSESQDLSAEIEQGESEIKVLQDERAVAARSELWDKLMAEAKVAVAEATEIEKHLTEFANRVQPHRDRLQRIGLMVREVGGTRAIDGRWLHRRVGAVLHALSPFETPKQHAEYNRPYPELLQALMDSIGRFREPENDKLAGVG